MIVIMVLNDDDPIRSQREIGIPPAMIEDTPAISQWLTSRFLEMLRDVAKEEA